MSTKKARRLTPTELYHSVLRQMTDASHDAEIRLLKERNDNMRHHAKVLETIATNLSKQSRIYQTPVASYEEYSDS